MRRRGGPGGPDGVEVRQALGSDGANRATHPSGDGPALFGPERGEEVGLLLGVGPVGPAGREGGVVPLAVVGGERPVAAVDEFGGFHAED